MSDVPGPGSSGESIFGPNIEIILLFTWSLTRYWHHRVTSSPDSFSSLWMPGTQETVHKVHPLDVTYLHDSWTASRSPREERFFSQSIYFHSYLNGSHSAPLPLPPSALRPISTSSSLERGQSNFARLFRSRISRPPQVDKRGPRENDFHEMLIWSSSSSPAVNMIASPAVTAVLHPLSFHSMQSLSHPSPSSISYWMSVTFSAVWHIACV